MSHISAKYQIENLNKLEEKEKSHECRMHRKGVLRYKVAVFSNEGHTCIVYSVLACDALSARVLAFSLDGCSRGKVYMKQEYIEAAFAHTEVYK